MRSHFDAIQISVFYVEFYKFWNSLKQMTKYRYLNAKYAMFYVFGMHT